MPAEFTALDNVDIILADDEDDNLDVAEMSLTCHGFDDSRIVKVQSGEEAIQAVEEAQEGEDEVPLVVVLDLNMPPKMGGAEAAERMKEALADMKRPPLLVCCSAGKIEDLKSQPWAKHFDHFVSKPFTPQRAAEIEEYVVAWCNK